MKLFFALVLACVGSQALAQQTASVVSSIRVTAESTVNAKPDRVQIDVGVETQAAQSQAAASQNATRVDAVLTALRKAAGSSADIRTISYSLNPNYVYPPNGGQPKINGYTASNIVRVLLDDLPRLGSVIDAATQAGANHIQGIQFTLRDSQAVRAQALREAATKARGEADALASALSLKVMRILTVEENGPVVIPMHPLVMAAARKESPELATPIQPGTIEVNANVTLTVEVSAGAR
jgi:uncharacterized protein YggE